MKIRSSIFGLLFLCLGVAAGTNAFAGQSVPARDPANLQLAAGSAMVVDLDSDKVLYASNPDVVVPIASISKLMTAVVTLDAKQPMDELIPVTINQTRELKGVYSRVRVNSWINRKEMLRLALMSSENRAAASLGHHYPGGYARFIAAMNAKAKALGMNHTHFVEPTGLSEKNVSTARDLVKLLQAARTYPLIRELSTTAHKDAFFQRPNYALAFNNTNPLVRKSDWDIAVTKTGFTDEAGHCLALVPVVQGRPMAVVLLDTYGKHTHFADAARVRRWLETGNGGSLPPAAAISYKKQRGWQWRQAQAATAKNNAVGD